MNVMLLIFLPLVAVIVRTAEGEIVNRNGCFKLDTDELVGSWCEVFRKDWENSVYASCSFSEINQPKNPSWQKQPCVMSEKTALVRALRSAFVSPPFHLGYRFDAADSQIAFAPRPFSSFDSHNSQSSPVPSASAITR